MKLDRALNNSIIPSARLEYPDGTGWYVDESRSEIKVFPVLGRQPDSYELRLDWSNLKWCRKLENVQFLLPPEAWESDQWEPGDADDHWYSLA